MKLSSLLEFLYYLAFNSKKILYKLSIFKQEHVGVPVISVGNITSGGTGKTPAVIKLYQILRPFYSKIGILSRGYKSPYTGYLNLYSDGNRSLLDSEYSGDEPALIWRKLGDYPGVSGKNRARSADYIVRKLGVKAILLDDAFQYWKFKRDLNIVLVDKCNPFGGNRLLPTGRLREHFSNIKRADMIIITRANHKSEYTLKQIYSVIKRYNPDAVCSASLNLSGRYYAYKNSNFIEETVFKKRIHAFCGLGNPDNFFDDLKSRGAIIVKKTVFDDHHEYSLKDIESLVKNTNKKVSIVTTLKDWVKIEKFINPCFERDIGYYDLETSFPEQELLDLMKKKSLI